MTVRVRDVAELLQHRFPSSWAEPWDSVGLRIGDPERSVERVYVALDATVASIREAAAHGCQALVTHHPPFLGDLRSVTADGGAGTIVVEALSLGVAVISEHTNLDRSPEGWKALAARCGFGSVRPLERSLEDVDLVTVFAPEGAEDRLIDAMARAGAGRIGTYERCAYTAPGIGTFTPLPGSAPAYGDGGHTSVPELRIEMVAPPGDGERVARAAREAHPYEEPLITVARVSRPRAQASLGAVADTARMTLDELAATVSERLEVPVRVWGPPDTELSRIAFANGSGGSLIPAARAAGADAIVLGEVRYHDALTALEAGLTIVEAGHDATELPLVDVLAGVLTESLGSDAVVQQPRSPMWWVTRE
ncbi:MAG: Nif3-like dinuclear metal center hexameric protein [Anaerosomatales bacterium]|nr:Nif3-like dinuclear metal center hexameric protein [Anaerosomatales bacterium]